MNPSSAYEQMRADSLEGRELEASVLSRAARKLNRCVQMWDQRDTPQGRDQLNEALAFTQRLWTFLQVEISNPEHPMPAGTRRSVFQLSRYVDRTVMKLYSGGTLPQLKSLVDLNNEMAHGLSTKHEAEPIAGESRAPASSSWG